ncbi:MAG: biotin--[acetyl-CoA-carboxylase] ligase [Candidatus Odinarchaeota archaeon]|nr:biotin--[acetyl-CoA-carboxylase] ligase [Candidatus Odinarchaeota archaeon]
MSFFLEGFLVEHYEEVSSTMEVAKNLANKGAPDLTVVWADTQYKGKGRFNRSWVSPKGGLWISIILRPSIPPDKSFLMTFVGAISTCVTFREYGLETCIKWPNDIIFKDKKISGILLESRIRNDGIEYLVMGIGANINNSVSEMPEEIRESSTSFVDEKGEEIPIDIFLKSLLRNVRIFYNYIRRGDYKSLIERWKILSCTLNREVLVIDREGRRLQGIAVDVDENDGALIVRTNKGPIRVTDLNSIRHLT